jgi:hypothetical protein
MTWDNSLCGQKPGFVSTGGQVLFDWTKDADCFAFAKLLLRRIKTSVGVERLSCCSKASDNGTDPMPKPRVDRRLPNRAMWGG